MTFPINSKIFTAYPTPIFTEIDDKCVQYTIKLYQQGIIDSNDINIILDYDKDYPTRLFNRFELYYGDELIADNTFPCYTNIADKKMFKIDEIFPNYKFILDTTNKLLSFKIQRNIISAISNNIKIKYKTSTSTPKPLMKHKTLCTRCFKYKTCGNYQTSFTLDYEPHNYNMYFVYGNLYNNENYSDKPIKQLVGSLKTYALNDEKLENVNQLHRGNNRFTIKSKNEGINVSDVCCIVQFNYKTPFVNKDLFNEIITINRKHKNNNGKKLNL